MNKKETRKKGPGKQAKTAPSVSSSPAEDPGEPGVPSAKVAEIAVDLWRITQRAQKEGAGDRVLAACDRADGRLRALGFRLETMLDRPYDENLRVRVVDHEEGEGPRTILECLTPAVYYNDRLVREAEVVTKGGGGKAPEGEHVQ